MTTEDIDDHAADAFDLLDSAGSSDHSSSSLFDPALTPEDQRDYVVEHGPHEEREPYVDPEDRKRTIGMTTLFLVLMVLYIGFCLFYRRKKVRRAVGDYDDADGDNAERSLRRQQNQAVLDESTSAASRARTNAEEQAKLDERKANIKNALMLRLIVDDDEEIEDAAEEEECHVQSCQCEQCQYWRWDSGGGEEMMKGRGVGDPGLPPRPARLDIITILEEDGEDSVGELLASDDVEAQVNVARAKSDCEDTKNSVEEREDGGDATPAPAAATKGESMASDNEDTVVPQAVVAEAKVDCKGVEKKILEKKDSEEEESSDKEMGCDNTAAAKNPMDEKSSDDGANQASATEEESWDNGMVEAASSTTLGDMPSSPALAPMQSPLSPPSTPKAGPANFATPPTSPLPRLSLASPKRYTDVLNCGSRKSYADALNCSNHAVRSAMANCSDRSSSCRGVGLSKGGSNVNATDTISLVAIVSTYGEECNICLSQFQVGDRAAWSRHHATVDGDSGLSPESVDTSQVVNCVTDISDADARNPEGGEAAGRGCTHVFHEECISRWLLVRDGCPICRRSYFLEGEAKPDATVLSTVGDATNTGGAVGAGEMDLELGLNNNNAGDLEGGIRRRTLDVSAVGGRSDL